MRGLRANMVRREGNPDGPDATVAGGGTKTAPDRSGASLGPVLDSLTDALIVLSTMPVGSRTLPPIRAANRAALRLLGHPAPALEGAPATAAFARESALLDLLADVLEDGSVRERKLVLLGHEGQEIPVRVTASLLTTCEWSGVFDSCPRQQAGEPHCPDRLEGFLIVAQVVSATQRAERSRDLSYRISEMVHSAETMDDLYRSVHELLMELMPADNFSIALRGQNGSKEITFPYFVETGADSRSARRLTRCLAEYAFRRDEPLLLAGPHIQDLLARERVAVSAAPPVQWLGVPLRVGDRTTGLMVVTSYREGVRFGEEERELIRFISGQVAIAIERKRAGDERARLSSAVEHAADSIVITGPEGIIEYVNPAFETMSGFTREEAIGQTPRILKSGRHSVEFYRDIWTTLARGESWAGRLTNRRRDGTFYEVEAAFSVIRDASGRTVNYISVQHDVTHEVALEAQLRQSQKMEAVGKLAGGVAHDFNNVLSIIMGYGDLIMPHVEKDSIVAMGIEEIREAGLRAGALTRQLLAFSRRQILTTEVLSLNAVVADMEKMLRRLIVENIELVTLLDPDIGCVKADPGQIEQVVMNLAVNARDSMPHGGTLALSTGMIDLSELAADPDIEPGEYVQIVVTDTGCGMDAEVQARIFEPFFSTKEDGKGTGLGLSTVYGIVTQSGGHIAVHSRPNRGTTFRILLPMIDEELQDCDVIEGSIDEPSGEETVLLVEDEDAVRDLTREMLALSGYRVLEARDGIDALRVCGEAEDPIDLLLTDVIMPRMGGRELSQRIATESPETRILFMSGYTDAAIASEGVLEPNIAFLQKPFGLSVLMRKVRDVLDGPPWRAGVPVG